MRPMRLTLRAFGPYAGEQIVDFRGALGAGLFGIYGPTGSGKSSIFSAISFALFGEPARDDQDPSTLRSDHADPHCLTEVELIFELGGKKYLVRRRPEQMRPAQRGGKETKEAHCAWLFDVTDIALDEITLENQGTPIAEKKVSEVRDELERRLGYGKEQFRQIVLLPQGRFEKFLAANTNDRLAILRDLFDVSLYKRLTQKMKDEAKAAEEKIRADRRVCDSMLEQAGFATLEELSAGAQQAQEEQKAEADAAEAAKTNAVLAEQTLAAAHEVENAFAENEAAARALGLMEAKGKEIEKDKYVLDGARVAKSLHDVDVAMQRARADLSAASVKCTEAQTARAVAEEAMEKAAAALAAEQARRGESETLRAQSADLKRHRETLGHAGRKKEAKDEAARIERDAIAAFETAQNNRSALVREQAETAAQIKTAETAVGRRATLSAAAQELKSKLDAVVGYDRALKAVNDARTHVAGAREDHEKNCRAQEDAQRSVDEAEAALAGAQAQHLAEKLRPGQACPVCGSHEHPAPAHGRAESAGRNDAFTVAREALDSARKASTGSGQTLAAKGATLSEREAHLAALTKTENTVAELQEHSAKVHNDIEALGPAIDLAALRGALERVEGRLPEAGAAEEAARASRDQAVTGHALATQALEDALASVPGNLRMTEALEAAIADAEEEIRKRDLAFDHAVKTERDAGEKQIAARKDGESAANARGSALAKLREAEQSFGGRLATNGFTQEQYEAHKANIGRIEELQASIERFGQHLHAARDRVGRAATNVEGRERPDVAGLSAVSEEATRLRDEAYRREASAVSRAESLAKLADSIAGALSGIKKAEDAYAPLAAVAHAFSGKNNANMELEAFAIAAMFDLVLASANARFKPMSGGQYSLERERDVSKGAGKKGLDIVVHDVHTGRTRPTATLSGGETFMAALALALGLSDVVESVNGGVHLNTIFIDEGFGTLDMETLDQALQTLQDIVGESRAVGLISHVELVQQAIPFGFQISKTTGGSHISQRFA
ncbi:AAA family ATPase [Rhizobium ruizarguesonis]|uniref:AAA family ATPase n=2 Tax=Rhizobium ruizarguesonis TaxID=2081791 RepID=UPI00103685B5|nr:SMC family ATPase [Rhizobium ruizarguesonis]NEI81386.1 AAA family ATPase [Rhizobium ruizarguesonis]NEK06912.1 AAA family ATPase [Rhizobium ruizarguesonis]TBD39637.1 SMC family ATPase [Rhizobium ruizarguesonis]